jgi:putative membrane protein
MKATPATPNRIYRHLAAAMIAASIGSALMSQPAPTPTVTPDEPPPNEADGALKHHDRVFMRKAAVAGGKEIPVSQAVMEKLGSSQLRDFAQMMITDHTAAAAELATLAASKDVQLPPADSSVADEWSKKTGDVDGKYIKEMVSDHEDAVKLFEKATKSTDTDVAAFAQKTLPTIQHHLMMAQELAKTMN